MPANEPAILAQNRSFKYGHGLFETMAIRNGKITLSQFHFDRLIDGMHRLNIPKSGLFSPDQIEKEILSLCKKNGCIEKARVRLSVSGNGSMDDLKTGHTDYLIEAWPLDESNGRWNEKGLVIDLFDGARKVSDRYSDLKTTSALCYVLAASYARENQLDDCLVLNDHGYVTDCSIANIFLIKGENIFTPSLSSGCVGGVMRRHLLEQFTFNKVKFEEVGIRISDFMDADEVFLTNAIRGIRWVKQFREKVYTNAGTRKIYDDYVRKIFS